MPKRKTDPVKMKAASDTQAFFAGRAQTRLMRRGIAGKASRRGRSRAAQEIAEAQKTFDKHKRTLESGRDITTAQWAELFDASDVIGHRPRWMDTMFRGRPPGGYR